MQRYLLILVVISTGALTIFAQDKRAEVFLGYSNLQANRSFDDLGNLSNFSDTFKRNGLHGVEGAVTGFPASWFGITGSISYHRKETSTAGAGITSQYKREVTYFMAGPTFKIRNPSRIEPFVHGLFGGANLRENYTLATTSGTGTTQVTINPSTTKFALAVGGGLDVRLGNKFSLRLIQLDYVPIFTGDRVVTVNNNTLRLSNERVDAVKVSVGIVF